MDVEFEGGMESIDAPRQPTATSSARMFTEDEVQRMIQRSVQAALAGHHAAHRPQAEEEIKQAERRRQQQVVHNSRLSVGQLSAEAVNVTWSQPTYAAPHTSPLRPPLVRPAQSRESKIRRMSDGYADSVPSSPTAAAPLGPAPAAAVVKALGGASVEVDQMDNEQFRRYESAAKRLDSSVTKFHGDRAKDGNRTVQDFVKLINGEMDKWLRPHQQHGRLDLVIGRTDGSAQKWLVDKRDELQKLVAAGQVTDTLLTEWGEIQDDFISEMSKGITVAMYEQQLRSLKIRDKDGQSDVHTFIRRFDEICAGQYPHSQFTTDRDKRRRLGEKFEERLKYCGGGPTLRDDCSLMMAARNISERDRTVDDWQDALLVVTSTDKWLNAKDGAPSTGRQKRQFSGPNKQTVSAMAAPQSNTAPDEEGSTQSDEGRQEGAQTAVVPAQRSRGSRNPHLSSDQLTQLLAKKPHVCLQCYKTGHYSRECRKPANRAPTEAELKA